LCAADSGKPLSPTDDSFGDPVLLDEGFIGSGIQHISRKALGADRLHRFQIEREENRDISCPLDPGLPGKIREENSLGFIRLERSIN
jgi:hypothetical protein